MPRLSPDFYTYLFLGPGYIYSGVLKYTKTCSGESNKVAFVLCVYVTDQWNAGPRIRRGRLHSAMPTGPATARARPGTGHGILNHASSPGDFSSTRDMSSSSGETTEPCFICFVLSPPPRALVLSALVSRTLPLVVDTILRNVNSVLSASCEVRSIHISVPRLKRKRAQKKWLISYH